MDAALKRLDQCIAEQVMGLHRVGWYRRKSCKTFDFELCAPGDRTPDYPEWTANLLYYHQASATEVAVPRYSTQIADAMTVVERVRLRCRDIVFRSDNRYPIIWTVELVLPHHRITTTADTLPLAICLGVLKMMGAATPAKYNASQIA